MTLSPEGLVIETMFRIPNKEGEDVDFKLNSAQKKLDAELTGRDLIPKARQEGISSYYLARFTAACMMYRNTRAVVISHDKESTQRLFMRVRYYVDNLRGPKPVLSTVSKNEISFPKMGSTFWIGTAGTRQFGRGDTVTHLHCSEYAYWKSPKELMTGLLQAVPASGEIGIESTGNGLNDYHRRCMRAYQGSSHWAVQFFPWHTFVEYTMELTDEEELYLSEHLNEEWEEPALIQAGLTLGQIAWRRMKLDEMDYDITAFKREYPMTLDECFLTSSESVFTRVHYEYTDEWKKRAPGLRVLGDHPRTSLHYTIGGDVAAGVGKDSSVLEVFCIETAEQVGEYSSNRIDPQRFAEKCADIGKLFNEAYMVVENNNHGILTLATLKDLYPSSLIYSDPSMMTSSEERQLFELGYRTTSRTRPLMIGRLRTKLAKDWIIHSPLLRGQLSTFIENPKTGKLEATEGCEDDTVIAAACASMGSTKAEMLAGQKAKDLSSLNMRDPFLVDNIIKEMHLSSGGFPISPQHGRWN